MVKNKAAKPHYEKAKTSVCWDIDNCPIPKGCKAEGVAQKIISALHKLNYRGQVSIFAFGNMNHIPPFVKQALSSTGITLEHVNFGPERGEVRKRLYDDVMFWGFDNPPPANIMFICRDEETRSHNQEMERGYNILLMQSQIKFNMLILILVNLVMIQIRNKTITES
ncbi:PREDICTED: uncharacterized protein LOC104778983 [Camelina sativa]|uniref:Uncharacterized protein LOC104778983 n=1 Tax=Camelina sativa TaxID=90675 RepID=A0ABM1R9S5_CAMSA|nr:PREDICTED: uncharacterized protein LOC104778983 [Camelina sativa]